MEHNVARFAQIAVRVWGCQMDFAHPEITAKAGIAALRAFWKSIGMPGNFADLNAREEDIEKLLDTLEIDGTTLGNFVKLNREDCEAIYRIACRA